MGFYKKDTKYCSAISKRLATPIALAAFTLSPLALAIEESKGPALEEVLVTAQKRSENLQDVPISINALGSETLDNLHVSDFKDFAKMLPSVSYAATQPGFAQVYMRGVASGGDGNHSGSQPSVGMYLDEQPITTIQGALDIHVYDVARVEALAGPQGTLYGASSQAGTIRIITNKPDMSGFSAGYGVEANQVDGDETGHILEGFVNIPLSDNAAVRIVAWDRDDAGYIDNVEKTRDFRTGVSINNAHKVEDNYNTVDTTGARAALKIDLTDNWSATTSVMTQQQDTKGFFGHDETVGDDKVAHYYPEYSEDEWTQYGLTLEGSISDFDVVYAGSYLDREVDYKQDYQDYTYWYDQGDSTASYWFYDDDGNYSILPTQYNKGNDDYTKESHELRVSSPQDSKLRYVVGLFWQEQTHDILQDYKIDGLSSDLEVPEWDDTLWLTNQVRIDKDKAVFGEVTYDFTEKLTGTAGIRYFESDNSLEGYWGFGLGYTDWGGEVDCFKDGGPNGAPCTNMDKKTDESDHITRFNLTYQLDDDKMIYGTFSEGYRPGGINRRTDVDPYVSDFLTNYEFGWKTTWMDNRLKWNGAFFFQEWEDFQFSILGDQGLTIIKNANQAEIMGLEMDVDFAVTNSFTLSGGVAFYDAELTENYCGTTDDSGNPITNCDNPEAKDGTQLPITAKVKGNITGRYIFDLGGYDAHIQAATMFEGDRESDLRAFENELIGEMDSYTITDLTAGIENDSYAVELYVKNVFDERGDLSRYAPCSEGTCGEQIYVLTTPPRTIGIKFSQEF